MISHGHFDNPHSPNLALQHKIPCKKTYNRINHKQQSLHNLTIDRHKSKTENESEEYNPEDHSKQRLLLVLTIHKTKQTCDGQNKKA